MVIKPIESVKATSRRINLLSPSNKKTVFISIILLISFLLGGCSPLTPRAVPQNRQAFNISLQSSEEEQLLLNLVRMQYGDRPYFLGVEGVTSQMEMSASISGRAEFTKSAIEGDQPGVGISSVANYLERPTLMYAPLQGEKFTTLLLTPVSIEKIYLLIQSGWSVARVLRVAVQSVGYIPNATNAARPSSSHAPEYKEFEAFAHYLRQLHLNDEVVLAGDKIDGVFCISIIVDKKKANPEHIAKLFGMLHVPTTYDRIILTGGNIDHASPNMLPITTRSFLGVMYYLSKGVMYSKKDISDGVVDQASYPDGRPFDWWIVTQGMIKIPSSFSAAMPKNANVAVHYRNRWFYIADNDSDSKQTIALVEQLFALQAGEVKGTAPLVTLSL